jgi:hypothetical protein
VVLSAWTLDTGAAAPDGGGGAIFFATSSVCECWSASLAVCAAGWRRALGAACGVFRRPLSPLAVRSREILVLDW